MFEIEAHKKVVYTCTISDENEEKIREYIEANSEKFQYQSDEEAIIKAIEDLDIDVLDGDYIQSEAYIEDIVWSEFEERTGEEILKGR